MTNSEKLREAINLIKKGYLFEARVILGDIIKQQPDWIDPWMWMAQALESDEDRLTLMEHCERYIPEDENVKRAVLALREKVKNAPKKKKTRSNPFKDLKIPNALKFGGIAIALLLIVIVAVFIGTRISGPDGVIAFFPTHTPTQTITQTPTITPTVTLTPSPTSTNTPTPTPTITPTPLPPEINAQNIELLQSAVILEDEVISFALDSNDQNLAYAVCVDEVEDRVCQDVELRVMDLETSNTQSSFSNDLAHVFDLAFTTDDSAVISGGCSLFDSELRCHTGRILKWDFESGSLAWDTEVGNGEIRNLNPAPDEISLVSGGFAGAYLWDIETGINSNHLAAEFFYTFGVDFSTTNSLVAVSGNMLIIIHDMESLERIGKLEGHTDHVQLLKFIDDGSRLVSYGSDDQLIFWDLETSQAVNTTPLAEEIMDMVYLAEENLLILASKEGSLIFFDATTKEILHSISTPEYSYRKIIISNDQRSIFALSTHNDLSAELVVWEIQQP